MKTITKTPNADTDKGAVTHSTELKPQKRRRGREGKINENRAAAPTEACAPEQPEPISAPRATSKIATVVALLERTDGATLAEMVAATGWLPHTTRAALTGLRKKGHALVKDKRGGVTCYHIAKASR